MNGDPRKRLKDVRLFPERQKKSNPTKAQPVKSQQSSARKAPPKPISPDEARHEKGLEALDASDTLRWASTGNAAMHVLTKDGLDGDRARRLARQIATNSMSDRQSGEAKAAGPMDTGMIGKGAPEPAQPGPMDTAVQDILEKDAPGDHDALRQNLGIGAHSPDRRRR
jgi:hypothetical protein